MSSTGSAPMPDVKLTGNMCQWFSDLLSTAISDAKTGAENEHIWANGAETPEAATMHENNAEELKQYAEFLEGLKAHYAG